MTQTPSHRRILRTVAGDGLAAGNGMRVWKTRERTQMSFFSSAFRGFASLFTPKPAAPTGPGAPAPQVDPAAGFWAGIFRSAVDVALTKPGDGRRRDAVRKALTGGAGAIALAAVLAGGGAQRAEAQGGTLCAAREDVVERLQQKYGESRRGIGLLQDQRVVEIWTSPKSGTWTIVVTLPDGSTCLLAAGEDWEVMDEPAPVSDRDA